MHQVRSSLPPFGLRDNVVGAGVRARPRRRAMTKIIAGICLRRELEGVKLAISLPFIKHEKVICLIKAREMSFPGPSLSLVESITEKGTDKPLEPEDIEHGVF